MESFAALLDTAKERLKDYQLPIPEERMQRLVAEGDPGWIITSWAEENDVDLIMMGTHGYGRIRGFRLGSIAAKPG